VTKWNEMVKGTGRYHLLTVTSTTSPWRRDILNGEQAFQAFSAMESKRRRLRGLDHVCLAQSSRYRMTVDGDLCLNSCTSKLVRHRLGAE